MTACDHVIYIEDRACDVFDTDSTDKVGWVVFDRDGTTVLIQRQRNGVDRAMFLCMKCRCTRGPFKRSHAELYDLPVLSDTDTFTGEPCSVQGCDRTDTERHHWAPRHLFDDAEQWPQSYLCRGHHKSWHLTTRTHRPPKQPDEALVTETVR
jgi:hypothetical protein